MKSLEMFFVFVLAISIIALLWQLEDATIALNNARMQMINSKIEYLRLKTAMAVIGLDDVRETSDGHAEFIWSKTK